MDSIFSDLRFAFRSLRRTPGFTTAAVVTLAIGIGANTAIFSIVDHVMLRPLGYREADRLFVVHETVTFRGAPPLVPVTASHFLEWQRSVRSFEESAMVDAVTLNLTGSGEPEQLHGARTSPALFRMFGVQPRLGRTFLAEETEPGRDRVVVLNADLWRRRFASDPNVVGRTIALNGELHEIVGVLPGDFFFPRIDHLFALTISAEQPQFWKPLALSPGQKQEFFSFNFAAIVRLKAGVTQEQALAELNAVQASLSRTAAGRNVELGATLVALGEQITSRSSAGLRVLVAAVAVVLLICCVNLTNLMLVRGAGRARELAVRAALGGSALRLARQLLVESLLLACVGGAVGLAVAYVSLPVIRTYVPVDIPRLNSAQLDLRVLFFSVGVSLIAGVAFGVLPALRSAKADPHDAMASGSRTVTAGRATGWLRSTLVSLEVGLSAVCLVAGALLLHSFVRLLNVDPGFAPDRLITADVTLSRIRYPNLEAKRVFLTSLLERLQAIPGVVSAGVTNRLPLTGHGGNNIVSPEGANARSTEQPNVDMRQVNPAFFHTIGIPLMHGRIFEDRDRDRAGRVAVISTRAAARIWPGQNPLGRRFYRGRTGDSPMYEVIGVVGDVRGVSLHEDLQPTVYEPYWQQFYDQASIVIRTANESLESSSAVRAALRDVDAELPIPAFRTMNDLVRGSVAERRFQMTLVLLFGLFGLSLASVGIYGVVSYSVAQRTNEIGIRMSLGAAPAAIRRLVLREGLLPVGAGLAAGLAAAVAAGQVLRGMLFGVTTTDPMTLISVPLILSIVSLVACYLPARRAMRVNPMVALRTE